MTKKKTDNCDPVYLSHYFDALSSNKEMDKSERHNIIGNMIQGCYNYKMSNGSNVAPVKPVKAKRKPSAWNCYIKKNKGQSFAELSPQFKALSPKERREYDLSAESGCE